MTYVMRVSHTVPRKINNELCNTLQFVRIDERDFMTHFKKYLKVNKGNSIEIL